MNNTEKERYSIQELNYFKKLLLEKLDQANRELDVLQKILSRQDKNIESSNKMFEDNAEITETENISQLAERQQKFIKQIENALLRIQNGTYGICFQTGKLIDKNRLKVVPHTMYSVDCKLPKKQNNMIVK